MIHIGRWGPWLAALAAATAAMVAVRPYLDRAHIALLYMLLVLAGSSRSGRSTGLLLSVGSFLCFNFFFVPPFHTFTVGDPADWLVLLAFLVTSLVAAQLLARAQLEAAAAMDRAEEIDRLGNLGAEALHAARAGQALAAIVEMIRKSLDVDECEIFSEYSASRESSADVSDDDGLARQEFQLPTGDSLIKWVAANSRSIVERLDGTIRIANHRASSLGTSELQLDAVRVVLVPLAVADRTVGVLRLLRQTGLDLDPARVRFVDAIAYYAALGIERVRLESEAEHADALRERDALKNAMLASVSHDLRTPLTTIKALAHDIRLEGDERAATIEEEADRLNRLVADLLDLSRIAGKALMLAPEINAVEDLLGAAVQRVAGTLNGRTVQVHLDTTQPLLLGRFDFTHSLRIVVNLLDNSIKFSPHGAVIDVTADGVGEAVEIVVADRGGGVPAAEADRIFEPFYRSALSSAGMPGSGLGLSIARDLAEAQGGALRYEPRAGGGSRFLLTLPGARLDEMMVSMSHAPPISGSVADRN